MGALGRVGAPVEVEAAVANDNAAAASAGASSRENMYRQVSFFF